jgi:hypothetical protein
MSDTGVPTPVERTSWWRDIVGGALGSEGRDLAAGLPAAAGRALPAFFNIPTIARAEQSRRRGEGFLPGYWQGLKEDYGTPLGRVKTELFGAGEASPAAGVDDVMSVLGARSRGRLGAESDIASRYGAVPVDADGNILRWDPTLGMNVVVGKSSGQMTPEGYTFSADPLLNAKLISYINAVGAIDPESRARIIRNVYGQAAGEARREAGGVREMGAATERSTREGFTRAGAEAAAMAEAGAGTDVAGLVGPSQTLQSIYTTVPGMGVTEGQYLSGVTDYVGGVLDQLAADAEKAGTQASKNFVNYLNNLTASERYRLENVILDDISARRQGFQADLAAQRQLDAQRVEQIDAVVSGLWGQGGNTRKALQNNLNIKSANDIIPAVDRLVAQYGAPATARYINSLAASSGS